MLQNGNRPGRRQVPLATPLPAPSLAQLRGRLRLQPLRRSDQLHGRPQSRRSGPQLARRSRRSPQERRDHRDQRRKHRVQVFLSPSRDPERGLQPERNGTACSLRDRRRLVPSQEHLCQQQLPEHRVLRDALLRPHTQAPRHGDLQQQHKDQLVHSVARRQLTDRVPLVHWQALQDHTRH